MSVAVANNLFEAVEHLKPGMVFAHWEALLDFDSP